VKLRPVEATEYLKANPFHIHKKFVVDVTAQEFNELYSSVKALRSRMKRIASLSPSNDLNDFLREVLLADLQMRFIINKTEWEIHVLSHRVIEDKQPSPSDCHHANGNLTRKRIKGIANFINIYN